MGNSQVNLNTNYNNYNNYGNYNLGRFGTLTTEEKAYQGRYEGTPSAPPQVAFIPTEKQMIAAQAWIDNKKNSGSENIFISEKVATKTQDARGAAWNNYDISKYNPNLPESRSEILGQNVYCLG